MSVDPLIILGPSMNIVREWAKVHVKASERMPVCIDNLDRLQGTRGRCIVILGDTLLSTMHLYILRGNTVIDLRKNLI